METNIPTQSRSKTFVRRSPKTLISTTPLRVAVPTEISAQETSPIRVNAFFQFPQSQFLISLLTYTFVLQKERRSKKKAKLNSPLPPPQSKPKPLKRKAIIPQSKEEEEK